MVCVYSDNLKKPGCVCKMIRVFRLLMPTEMTLTRLHKCTGQFYSELSVTQLHSEQPKLQGVLAVMSAVGLIVNAIRQRSTQF